jgi:osmotically-inducible protein OsmY
MNKAIAPLRTALASALALAALAACDRQADGSAATGDDATVGQKVDRALAQTRQELARAGEQVKPTLERAGDSIERGAAQVKPTLDKAGEKIKEAAGSDAAITASIKADYLKDPDLSVFKIDVDTRDGVVTLNGITESAAARMRAEKLAAANKGVLEVRNRLTVKQG